MSLPLSIFFFFEWLPGRSLLGYVSETCAKLQKANFISMMDMLGIMLGKEQFFEHSDS